VKRRIAWWAAVGFLVAVGWAVYASAGPAPITSAEPTLIVFAGLTQPIVAASLYFHFGLHVWWVVVANAATYALLGAIVEALRKRFHQYECSEQPGA